MFIGAWSFVKKEIAAPVHNMVLFIFKFFLKYNPKISCLPPPIFVSIKSGFTFLIFFKSFLSDISFILYFGAR